MAINYGVQLILENLLARFGPNLTFEEAAIYVLRFPTVQSAYTARNRGKFPLRMRDRGGGVTISLVDVYEWLVTGEPQVDSPTVPKVKRPGRPRKLAKPQHKNLGESHG